SDIECDDIDGLVDELLGAQPDAHAYFGRMKIQNRQGPKILDLLPEPVHFAAQQLKTLLDQNRKIFSDTREYTARYNTAVTGALSIPDADKAGTHIAWAYNPEAEHRELVVLADNATQAREYRDHFIRVGVDTLTGYTTA